MAVIVPPLIARKASAAKAARLSPSMNGLLYTRLSRLDVCEPAMSSADLRECMIDI